MANKKVAQEILRVGDEAEDGCDGYRIFRGSESNQVRASGKPLDPHEWYYEPENYQGDVAFDCGFATRVEAVLAARTHDFASHD